MNKHIKRWLVALAAVAFVILIGLGTFSQTSNLETSLLVALLVGVAFLHTHLAQLVRDQNARLEGRTLTSVRPR